MKIKHKLLNVAISLSLIMIFTASYGASFTVNNNSQYKGIYITYNSGGSFPNGCVASPKGSTTCCVFKSKNASFSLSGGSGFNISVGRCGSSGLAQAEFKLGGSSCGRPGSCDWVDGSTVSGSKPTVIIKASTSAIVPPGEVIPRAVDPINTGGKSCGVYATAGQNCSTPTFGGIRCPSNDFCHNKYPTGTTYTITFN